jgi:hypothetical protein
LVWEIHFTKDFYVGELEMKSLLSRLSKMRIPRFQNGKYKESTLYFHSRGISKEENKSRTICIYDKGLDCIERNFSLKDIETTKGIMRVELRYRNPNAVRRLVKKLKLTSNKVKHLVNLFVSEQIIEPIQKEIFKQIEETTVHSRISKVIDSFPKRRHPQIFLYLFFRQVYGTDFYKLTFLRFSRSAYFKCQKECRESGVLFLFDEKESQFYTGNVP